MGRKLGIAGCLLGVVAVALLALNLGTPRPFAGLSAIQEDIADRARLVADSELPGVDFEVRGREIHLTELPATAPSGFDLQQLQDALGDVDGVRSVQLADGVSEPQSDVATPEPTPPTDEADPTPEEAPTEEPAAEPTPEATPEPSVAPLETIVAGLDLGEVEFEPGTAVLTDSDQALLSAIANELFDVEGAIEVRAHTNNDGDPDVNLLLSQERAEAVADFLTAQGAGPDLTARGFGAAEPIADNSTEQGRAANQRVELVVEGN